MKNKILILLLVMFSIINPASAYLDLTGFVKVDPNSHLTVTSLLLNVSSETDSSSKINKTFANTSNFVAAFELQINKANLDGAWEVLLSDTNSSNPGWTTWGSSNAVGMRAVNRGTYSILQTEKWVSGAATTGAGMSIVFGTKYYITLSRASTTLTLSVYSDSGRTTHIPGSPETLTVTSAAFDNFQIVNNIGYAGARSYNVSNVSFTLSSPTITNPTANSVPYADTSVYFNWTNVSGAVSYDYQVSNNSGFTDLLYNSNTTNNSVLLTIPQNTQQFFRVRTNSEFDNSSWSDVVSIRDLSLSSPASGSTLFFNFPPINFDFSFQWLAENSSAVYFNLLVAKDPNFNLIVSDTTAAGTTRTVTLSSGQHWYKVRPYYVNTGIYGQYTAPWNFTVVQNASGATGTGIQGIIYELTVDNIQSPITGATVYLYNNTYSASQITGTNGYYLFTGLNNSTTYNIYSTKQGYEQSPALPITTGQGNISTNNILMKIYISPYVPNFVFERFIVRDLFDRSYPGVSVSVYKGDALTTSFTGTTDSTGAAVFQLIKDQRYRITFTGGGITDTITVYVYAKEENYFIRVLTGFPTGGDRYTDIQTNLTAIAVNATYSALTLIYNDTKLSTSTVNFYATNLTTGSSCYTSSGLQAFSINCTVLSSGSYQFGFNSTSSIYGFFEEDRIINFGVGKPDTPMVETKVDKELMQWASIILIVLFASLFSVRNIKFGAVLVPLLSLVLWVFGWFEPVANNQAGSLLLLSCATVIGIMIYLRMSEVKTQF